MEEIQRLNNIFIEFRNTEVQYFEGIEFIYVIPTVEMLGNSYLGEAFHCAHFI